jgi:proline-specific peptidase
MCSFQVLASSPAASTKSVLTDHQHTPFTHFATPNREADSLLSIISAKVLLVISQHVGYQLYSRAPCAAAVRQRRGHQPLCASRSDTKPPESLPSRHTTNFSSHRTDSATGNVTEGFAPFDYPAANKSLETWYRITGTLDSSGAVPLITLHGGPGGGHAATNPFTSMWASRGIPVVQYDQIGCGNSTHLTELASAGAGFWNDGLFVAELESLVANLGLAQYDVLGYSWGGMLAARFASGRPAGLRRLVLMSAPASSALWAESMADLRATLPADVQAALNDTSDTDAYNAALEVFEDNFLCRVSPTPADVTATTNTVIQDPTVYEVM